MPGSLGSMAYECRYAQVLTELGVVLSFSPPEGLQNLMDTLRDFLSITDIFASAKW
jgi:hypothetical protein